MRLAILAGLMLLVAAYDYVRHKGAATKWREYVFLCLGATIAAGFGALNDVLTVTLSPLYFVLGKGLAYDKNLVFAAMGLGAQAGMVAGFICSGVLLLCSHPRWPYGYQYKAMGWILACAIVCECIGAVIIPVLYKDSDMLTALQLSPQQSADFYRVWGMHLGLYLGAVVGLTAVIVCRRRAEKHRRLFEAGSNQRE